MKNISIPRNLFIISKHTILMYAFFVLSCIHSSTLLVYLTIVPLVMLFTRGKKGAVEYLIFLQFRSLLSTGIAVPISGMAGLVKWGIVFIISFYLLMGYMSIEEKEIHNIIKWIFLFAFGAIVTSFVASSYPVTACFKVFSYAIPFAAIIKGVADTADDCWIEKINRLLGILVFASSILLASPIGFLRNGRSFQGVFNHPNVYAVLIAIFIAGFLYQERAITLRTIIVIVASVFLLYQTKSRTGMISFMIILVVFLITQEMKITLKLLLISAVVVGIGVLLATNGALIDIITEYLYKGSHSEILASRAGQIARNTDRFLSSPLVGTGFNVPYIPNYRSFSFSFDLVTENGNLFMALLGDLGVLGTILFIITYVKIYVAGHKILPTIYVVPFLVCMGEMAFFSTNNFAIVLYFYFAIYIVDGNKSIRGDL